MINLIDYPILSQWITFLVATYYEMLYHLIMFPNAEDYVNNIHKFNSDIIQIQQIYIPPAITIKA